MAQNPFSTNPGLRQASDWFAVTASDTVLFSQGCAIGVMCVTPGNAVLVSPQGNLLTVPMTAGQFLRDVQFVRINATGTTGTYAALL